METLRVLRHLQTRYGDTTAVGSLAGRVPDGVGRLLALALENVDSLLGASHVGSFGNVQAASLDEVTSIVTVDLVLGGGGKSDIALDGLPRLGSSGVRVAIELPEILEVAKLELELGNALDELGSEAVLGDEAALRIRESLDNTAKLDNLEGSVLSDVAGARDGDLLALPVGAALTEHLGNVVDEAETGGLGADAGSTEIEALAGENTRELIADLLVSTEHEGNLTSTNSNVTSGNISVGANVARELVHKGLWRSADDMSFAAGDENHCPLT